jgi:hypothetical protein
MSGLMFSIGNLLVTKRFYTPQDDDDDIRNHLAGNISHGTANKICLPTYIITTEMARNGTGENKQIILVHLISEQGYVKDRLNTTFPKRKQEDYRSL